MRTNLTKSGWFRSMPRSSRGVVAVSTLPAIFSDPPFIPVVAATSTAVILPFTFALTVRGPAFGPGRPSEKQCREARHFRMTAIERDIEYRCSGQVVDTASQSGPGLGKL